jgi:hypothetical protein
MRMRWEISEQPSGHVFIVDGESVIATIFYDSSPERVHRGSLTRQNSVERW